MHLHTHPFTPSTDFAEISHRRLSLICTSLFRFLRKFQRMVLVISCTALQESSWDASVDIVMGYRLRSWGLIPSRSKICFSIPVFRPALGPSQPPIQWYLRLTPKQLGHEADYSPPYSAKIMNEAILKLSIGVHPFQSYYIYNFKLNQKHVPCEYNSCVNIPASGCITPNGISGTAGTIMTCNLP